MPSLLLDVNIQSQAERLAGLVADGGLLEFMDALGIGVLTFADVGFAEDMDDRTLWHQCQEHDYVLLTENRNQADADSLQATLVDSWRHGMLPVLTLANRKRFERDRQYAAQVASDIAEVLFDVFDPTEAQPYRSQPRVWIPL